MVGALLALAACGDHATDTRASLTTLDASSSRFLTDSVRGFATSVAAGVSARGPAAWRELFVPGPAFFMASEGRLQFPDGDSAARAIDRLAHLITRIELSWGEPVRVDPLAPGLAVLAMPYREVRTDSAGHHVDESGFFTGVVEHDPAGWRFRNAHWSVVAAPSLVR
jgi:hypothetical protein